MGTVTGLRPIRTVTDTNTNTNTSIFWSVKPVPINRKPVANFGQPECTAWSFMWSGPNPFTMNRLTSVVSDLVNLDKEYIHGPLWKLIITFQG